jgi:DNA-binding response OmpR family regulator
MIKNVLLVDDDTEMLHALKEGFKKYQEPKTACRP